MKSLRVILLVSMLLASVNITSAMPKIKRAFPRIAGIHIGAKHYNHPDYMYGIARKDFVLMGYYRGWTGRDGAPRTTIRENVQDIKEINPNILMGQYTSVMEAYNHRNHPDPEINDKIESEKGPGGERDWWAYNADGNHVSSYPDNWNVNITRFVTSDADGDRYSQWYAKHRYQTMYQPIPEFNIWFNDGTLYQPRTIADWNGDGIDDDRNDPAVGSWYRQGIRDYFDAIRMLMPEIILMGNVEVAIDGRGALREPEYNGQLGAALNEHFIGSRYSIETWNSWENAMNQYHALIENTAFPHLVMLDIKVNPDDADSYYRIARYGLTSVLMNDGYAAIEPDYSTATWFDEYDAGGISNSSWMGRAIEPPQKTPWQNGVYKREFENALALVNPKGNGIQTVDVGLGWRRINGQQDTATNNGQPASIITLPERDGIILMRADAVLPKPDEPGDYAPRVKAGVGRKAEEGTQISLDPATFADISLMGPHTAIIDWGDGTITNPASVNEVDGEGTVSGSHAYGDNGTYHVSVEVTSIDDGTGSDMFTVEVSNVVPTVGTITASLEPAQVGAEINATADFADPGRLDTHTALWDWGDSITSPGEVTEAEGSGSVSGGHTYTTAGVYTVKLTVTDDDGGVGESIFRYVVIYDTSAGFVTGGGWITSPQGAYTPDTSLTGKANFGFVSKYKKGATVPTGNTEFNFKVANLNFHSSSYDWLVVAGHKAQYKGTGTINGGGNYSFMLTAIDEELTPSTDVDLFRIKIWDKDDDTVVYDNQMDAEDDADLDASTTAIGGGNIKIHQDGSPKAPVKPNPNQVQPTNLMLYDIPSETELLRNYPNPFNPETWIPFNLAEASEVIIRIFDMRGNLVRKFNLGPVPAGYYISKDKAVHWDGRNEKGEKIASGVYYYTFQAREFRAIFKMVIVK